MRRAFLIISLLLFVQSYLSAQKSIVLNAGVKLNSTRNNFFMYDIKPLGVFVRAGIEFENRLGTNLGFQYFQTQSEKTIADYYIFDIAVRRSFQIKSLSGLSLNLAIRPGYYYIQATGVPPLTHNYHLKGISLAASCGASYYLTRHIAIELSPGLTWYPARHPRPRIGTFLETGLTFKF